MRQRVAHWFAWWIGLVLLWQLFVNTFAAPEVFAGLLAAAIAATAAEVVRGQGLVHFHPNPRWLLRARKLPFAVLVDCRIVMGALWRQLRRPQLAQGTFTAVPFTAGGDDAEAAARRAIYVAAISLTPNTFVVGIDREKDTMLVHQLVSTAPTKASDLV
ncbi:MAG: Na+/H+ antiporter subunit E [Actinomycetota bacterium]|nr:Na+/H+ antiporter subunit E [Actinomycetota bacterium]